MMEAGRIDELRPDKRRVYALAIILSGFEPETRIKSRSSSGYRDNDLADRLSEILYWAR